MVAGVVFGFSNTGLTLVRAHTKIDVKALDGSSQLSKNQAVVGSTKRGNHGDALSPSRGERRDSLTYQTGRIGIFVPERD